MFLLMQDNARKTDSLSTMCAKLNEATDDIKSLKFELRNANDELQEIKIKHEEEIKCLSTMRVLLNEATNDIKSLKFELRNANDELQEGEIKRLIKFYKKQITETIMETVNKPYYKLSNEIEKEILRFDKNYELLNIGLDNLKTFVERKEQQTYVADVADVAELYSVNLDKIKSETCYSNAFWEQFEEETKNSVVLCGEELIKQILSVVKTLNYPERFSAMLKYINSEITISEKHYYKVNIEKNHYGLFTQSKHPRLWKYGDTLNFCHPHYSFYLQSQISNTNIYQICLYNKGKVDVSITELKRRGFIIDNTVLLFSKS